MDEEESETVRQRRKEIGRRILERREAMSPKVTQTDLNEAVFGKREHQTIQKIEKGDRGVTGEELVKISEVLDIDPRILVGRTMKRRQVPLLGDVGIGGEYFAHAGVGRWMEIKKVDAPLGDETVNAALRVVGKHLEAYGYWEGDMLYFRHPGDPVDDILGQRCIVQLRDSTTALLGVLSKGVRPGRYLFKSVITDEPTREVAVEWAARIRWHQQAG